MFAPLEDISHEDFARVTEVSYRDMDASVLGFPKGETPWPHVPAVLALSVLGTMQAASAATNLALTGKGFTLAENASIDWAQLLA